MATAFLVIGGFGLALVLVSLLFGEVLDHVFHAIDFEASGGLFSTPVIGAFLGAFGFTGWLVEGALGTTLATVAGIGAGAGIGTLVAVMTRAVMRMPTDPTPRSADLVGALGTVVTRIPEHGFGEVAVTRHGQRLKLSARATASLPAGASVVVVDVTSSTSVVVTESGF